MYEDSGASLNGQSWGSVSSKVTYRVTNTREPTEIKNQQVSEGERTALSYGNTTIRKWKTSFRQMTAW